MAELRKATSEMGIVVVNITQCPEGFVSKAYSGGWALEKAGVVAGGGESGSRFICFASKAPILSVRELTLPFLLYGIQI